ncbi:MAG: hypothetical protein U1A27_11075 [Phycisphaerae bacterium]
MTDVDGDGQASAGQRRTRRPPGRSGRRPAYLFSSATGGCRHLRPPTPGAARLVFGHAAAGLIDFDGNNDGRGDVAIGAPQDGPTVNWPITGRVYVFSGVSGGSLATLQAYCEACEIHFGRSLATVPDLSGDGRPDLAVGSLNLQIGNGPPVNAGRVHVFASVSAARLYMIDPPHGEYDGEFGAAISGIGDLDGDGRGDLVVGAPREDPDDAPIPSGRAYSTWPGRVRLLFCSARHSRKLPVFRFERRRPGRCERRRPARRRDRPPTWRTCAAPATPGG